MITVIVAVLVVAVADMGGRLHISNSWKVSANGMRTVLGV